MSQELYSTGSGSARIYTPISTTPRIAASSTGTTPRRELTSPLSPNASVGFVPSPRSAFAPSIRSSTRSNNGSGLSSYRSAVSMCAHHILFRCLSAPHHMYTHILSLPNSFKLTLTDAYFQFLFVMVFFRFVSGHPLVRRNFSLHLASSAPLANGNNINPHSQQRSGLAA